MIHRIESGGGSLGSSSGLFRFPDVYLGRLRHAFLFFTVFLTFTPFFSLYPIETDVQPISFMFILLLFSFRRMRRFTSGELFFLWLSIFSALYISVEYPYFDPRKSFGFMFAFLAYHFFRVYSDFINQKVLIFIVLVNCVAVIFHFLNPSIFIEIFGGFVREIKIESMKGARGASGFAAEPGFTGGLAVFYMAVSFYLKEFKDDCRFFYAIVFLCCLMIFLSRSGTGGMLMVLFFALVFFRLRLIYVLFGILFISAIYFLIDYVNLGRAGYAIRYMIEDPWRLATLDASVGQRVMNLAVGFVSVFEAPFGHGAGSFTMVSLDITERYGLADYIAGKQGNVSAFAKYSVELGLLFWLFLIFMAKSLIDNLGARGIKYLFVSMFFIAASFSIVFPPIWYFFAVSKK